MASTDDNFFPLDDDFETECLRGAPAIERASPAETCGECGGTGKWSGGVNRHGNTECFACRGRGFFLTKSADRAKGRERRRAAKARARALAVEVNDAHEITDALRECADWNTFAASLLEQRSAGRLWSDNQVAAARRMLEKIAATQTRRAAERAEAETKVGSLAPIKSMFDAAFAAGHRRPVYRAEGLVLSRAGDFSRNPGAIYVKSDDDGAYLGKVVDGVYKPVLPGAAYGAQVRERATQVAEALAVIAADPKAAAIRFGQKSGNCACCGRALTAKDSVELGIGPICASKWGLL